MSDLIRKIRYAKVRHAASFCAREPRGRRAGWPRVAGVRRRIPPIRRAVALTNFLIGQPPDGRRLIRERFWVLRTVYIIIHKALDKNLQSRAVLETWW